VTECTTRRGALGGRWIGLGSWRSGEAFAWSLASKYGDDDQPVLIAGCVYWTASGHRFAGPERGAHAANCFWRWRLALLERCTVPAKAQPLRPVERTGSSCGGLHPKTSLASCDSERPVSSAIFLAMSDRGARASPSFVRSVERLILCRR